MYKNYNLEKSTINASFHEETLSSQVLNLAIKPDFARELIFADGLCQQIAGLLPEAVHDTVALGDEAHPLFAISQELDSRRQAGIPVEILHIVAHGRPGAVQIGGVWIDHDTLKAHAAEIAGWQVRQIALWSCETGADAVFIQQWADLTGAVVFATASSLDSRQTTLSPMTGSPSAARLDLRDVFTRAAVDSMDFSLAEVSLVFNVGYLGTQGSTTNATNAIRLLSQAGISRVAFVQTDANGDGKFGDSGTQGNDLDGTLRIYGTDGSIVDLAGALNWRETTGSKVEVFGFIFKSGQDSAKFGITGGTTSGVSTNLGLRAFTSSFTFVSGEPRKGNAATSGLLDDLNAALADSAQPSAISLATASVTEGVNLVYTVTLDKATPYIQSYELKLTGGTATAGSDYNTSYTLSNGVTKNADGTLSVPAGVTSFTVTVPTVDDSAVESSETVILTVGKASGTGTILDNDVAAIAGLTLSQTSLTTSENGTAASFGVKLNTQPTTDVTVTLTGLVSTEGSLSATTLTFTPANWNVEQNVTVTGVDDTLTDGDIPYTLTATTSGDSAYSGANAKTQTIAVTNSDNDTAGLTLSQTSLTTSENGTAASFGIKLNTQPTSDVTVTLTGLDGTEGSLSTTTLTFTPANWNVEQNVTVTGVDDPAVDGNIAYDLVATTSGDSAYSGANAKTQTIAVTNSDNDTAGLTLSQTSLTTSENGTAASFGVKLNTQPTSDVTVTLTGLDGTEGSLSTTTLTFTPANWNVEQNVTVTGVDDPAVDGNIAYDLVATTSGDSAYSGANAKTQTIAVTNTDNDTAGLTLSKASLTTSENGTAASFGVKLNTQPTSDVTVTLTGLDSTEGSLSTTTLTFTPANWNVEQNVTVTGVDDPAVDGNIAYDLVATTSGDSAYSGANAKTQTIAVTNTDNDSAGLTLSKASLTTSENGTAASFGVKLNTQPTSDVTVTLTGLDSTEGSLSTTTLTFTPANWNVEQNVTVTGVDDPAVDGNIAYDLVATTSGDSAYSGANAKTQTIAVTNTDNDSAGLTLSKASLTTSENGTAASFGVKLNTQPTSDVTVTLTGLDSTEGSLSTTTLTFTPANWNVEQNVTVTGVDDPAVDGNIAYDLVATTSGDSAYSGANAKTQTIAVTNTDNDTASLTVTGQPDVSEGGNAIFTVTLGAVSAAPSEITLTLGAATDTAENEDYSAAYTAYYYNGATQTPLTITDGKLSLPAGVDRFYVKVATTADSMYEGAEEFTLAAALTGGNSGSATSTILDNGSGKVYDDKGQPIPGATPDDDRNGLSVTGGTYNEASDVALFTVTAPHGEPVTLTLGDIDTTGINGDSLIRYSTDGGATWQPYTGAFPAPLDGSPIQVAVSIKPEQDAVYEGSEHFHLTATTGGKTAEATATLKDDGTGDLYKLDAGGKPALDSTSPKDDDRPGITVSGQPDVSEGSPTVFTVALSNASAVPTEIALNLGAAGDTATSGTDYNPAFTAYYYDGAKKMPLTLTSGKITLPGGVTSFYVGVPTIDDATFEGSEKLTLAAAITNGQSDTGTSTLVDDGSGKVYDDKGQVIPKATPDDDRNALTATGGTYNEASDAALFTVTAPQGEPVTLTVSDIDTRGINKAGLIRYSTDGGANWQAYTGAFKAPLDGSPIRVAVALKPEQDAVYEGSESFRLTAATGGISSTARAKANSRAATDGKTAQATANILDDGTGDLYKLDANGKPVLNTTTPKDDDRPGISVSGQPDVSEGSPAVFTVSLSNASAVPTEIALNLGAAGDTATSGTDYNPAFTAYYYDGAKKMPLTLTGGKVTLPAGVTNFYVGVPTTDDAAFEGSEKLTLTANITNGQRASGNASLVDDGSGKVYDDKGQVIPKVTPDDDRNALTATGGTYNEASDAALFTVTAPQGEPVTLTVSDIDTRGINKAGLIRYSTDGGANWQAYTGAFKAPLDGSPIRVAVALKPEQDAVYEGSESFRLTVATGSETTQATASINDDGTGDLYKLNAAGKPVLDTTTPKDDDRPGISVSGQPDVSEGSPAVFTVSLSNASAVPTEIALNLGAAGDSATAGTDYNPAFTAYYYDGAKKMPLTLTSGKITLPAGVTSFYVGVPTIDDATFEGSEKLTLAAAITNGQSDTGTSTLVDDGSGKVYDDKGQPIPDATADDDRNGLSVTGGTYNEASDVALFTVTAPHGEPVTLTLGDIDTTGINGDSLIRYSTDGGATWQPYTGAFPAPLDGSPIKVAVAIAPEQDGVYEGSEHFRLTATTGGKTAEATATLKDDGTGDLYKLDAGGKPALDSTSPKDDDRPGITVSGQPDVSEGSPAVFTVSLSNASAVPTEIALNLGAAGDTATSGTDYNPAFTAYYYDGAKKMPLTLTGGKVTLPAGVTNFYVGVPTTDDAAFEGSEKLTLTANITNGQRASGNASLVDDGSGKVYDDKGQVIPKVTPDDDRNALTATGGTYNEASDAALFTVTAPQGEPVTLTVSDIDTRGINKAGLIRYSTDGGANWQAYTGAFKAPLDGSPIRVAVALKPEQDAVYEGSESFRLTVATGSETTQATASINDDGTGDLYKLNAAGKPVLDTTTPKDDDRPGISVSGQPDVSEGSPAVFTVSLSNASAIPTEIALNLGAAGDSATAGTDYNPAFTAYYYDGAKKMPLTLTSGKITLPGGVTSFYVGVPTIDDATFEGSEKLTLAAAITNGQSDTGTSTLVDDGSGKVYDDKGQVIPKATPDDDRNALTATGGTYNEASDAALFTVTAPQGEPVTLTVSDIDTRGINKAGLIRYSTDGGANWQAYTGAFKAPLDGSPIRVAVALKPEQDAVYEGSESFRLTVATGSETTQATASINDDGTGDLYKLDAGGKPVLDTTTPKDDDRPGISVSGQPDVSEGSPAVFTVSLSNASAIPTEIALNLGAAGDTATSGTDYNPAFTAYYYDGAKKMPLTLTSGKITLPGGVTSFYVGVPTIDDATFEGSEKLTLAAAITNGQSDTGTSTLVDDGSGKVYDDKGQPIPDATADDDRNDLSVTGGTYNEASDVALFTVKAPHGEPVTLSLGDIDTTGINGDSLMRYSTDGGATWQPYTGAFPAPLDGSAIKVAVAIVPEQDAIYEGSEPFRLTATTGSKTAENTATLKDDGTGDLYKLDAGGKPALDSTSPKDDDRPGITVSGQPDVSEGSPAVFTVSLSNASAVPTEIALNLGAAGDTATSGTDYNPAFTAYYYDGAKKMPLTLTGGKVTLPAGVTNFYVGVPTTDDAAFEGSEKLTLTANITNGQRASGTASLVDDGSGKVYDDKGQVIPKVTPDDDRNALTATGGTYNEASDAALFTVTAPQGEPVTLTVSDIDTRGINKAGLIRYSTDGGANWQAYTGAFKAPLDGSPIRVAVALKPEQDAVYEGSESFRLTAATGGISSTARAKANSRAATDGKTAQATANILDDGTGDLYKLDANGKPVLNTTTPKDDDRPGISVSGQPDVSEGSPAVFTVRLSNASAVPTEIALNLGAAGDSATAGTDYNPAISAYYYDGAKKMPLTLTGGKLTLPAGVTNFYVGVPTTDDAAFEGSEKLTLAAAITNGQSDTGTSTLVDDGSGKVYDDKGQPIPDATADDDRNDLSVTGGTYNEASDVALFTVTAPHGEPVTLTLSDIDTQGIDKASLIRYSTDGGATWQAYTGAFPAPLDGGAIKVAVTLKPEQDLVYEGSELFRLTAATGSETAQAAASINDDGTGDLYKLDTAGNPVLSATTPKDNDRPHVSVSGQPDVSEGSPTVFTVALSNASALPTEIALALGGTGDTTKPVADYNPAFSAYYYDGANQVPLTLNAGKISLPANVTGFYVGVPTVDDATFEGRETLTLAANITGGNSGSGASAIVDDGSGKVYNDRGQSVAATPDDDRNGLAVTGGSYNEASDAAFFVVTAPQGESVTLTLNDVDTTGINNGGLISYSTNGGKSWNPYTGAFPSPLDGSPIRVAVTLKPEQDAVYEGVEHFHLTAVSAGRIAEATASINDDGTGDLYKLNAAGSPVLDTTTPKDDDRPDIRVSGQLDVSEGSPTVFTVALSNASAIPTEIALALGGTGDTTKPVADYNPAFSAYYYDGANQVPLTLNAGKISLPANVTGFYVSVPTVDDATFEGRETLTLAANITGGNSGSGASAIVDDGSGKVYNDRGQPVTATPDDDRNGLAVTGGSYNEASDAAFFVVTAPQGESVTLTLSDVDTTGINNGGLISYSTNGGKSWNPYAGAFPAPLDGSPIRVAVTLKPEQDAVYEGVEHFHLTAVSAGLTAEATASINDDGTGDLYKLNAAGKPVLDTTTPKDDDRPGISVSGQPDVSEGSPAVFTVSLSNASAVPTEIALNLGAAGDTATSGTDYNPAFTAYYYDGAKKMPLTLTGGKVTLPAGVTNFYVGVPTTDDAAFEGSEKLTLTANITNGQRASGTSSLLDNGAGKSYDDRGQPIAAIADDDRSIQVSGLSRVSEGSNAVFTVTLNTASPVSSRISLDLGVAADTAETEDYNAAYTAYYYKGTTQKTLAITEGMVNLPAGVTRFHVKVASVTDTVYEGAEHFTLTADLRGGNHGEAATTLVDDGTGKRYDDKGQPVAGTADDDRNDLSVAGGVYNEASDVALFTVTAPQGEPVTLTLADLDTLGINDDGLIRYSTDEGASWQRYAGEFLAPVSGGKMLVAVAITGEQDDVFEGGERFQLTAATGKKTAEAKATIRDDGAGDLLKLNSMGNPVIDGSGQPVLDATTPRDDDTPVISVSNLPAVSEGSKAIFTVALSNPSATPTEIKLALGSKEDTARNGSDYSPKVSAWYYDGANRIPLDSVDGKVILPPHVIQFHVGVPSVDDGILEGSETLALTASIGAISSASGVSNFVDDGTGQVYDDQGRPIAGTADDDRAVAINNPIVNEASPYAVFTVDGAPGQTISLTLADGTAVAADYGNGLGVSSNGGTTWEPYSGRIVLNDTDGNLLVRTPIKQDITYEGGETFTLTATNPGSKQAKGTATIVDDGSGTIFNMDGSENLSAVKDDDRILKVENITVNEGSPYAVFRVSGVEGQQVALSLEETGKDYAPLSGNARVGVDTGTRLQYFDGDQWADYKPGSTVTYPEESVTLLVRVAINDDKVFEKQDSFKLKATADDLVSYGTGIISDDGQGPIYNESGAVDPNALRDDDRSLQIDSIRVNEGSGYAVFTVSATNGSQLELALVKTGVGDDYANLGVDTGTQLQYLAGGKWQNYAAGSKVPVNDGQLFVRVAIVNDTDKELSESFRLLAKDDVLGTAYGTATIENNGTGDLWLADSERPATPSQLVAAKVTLDDDFDRDGISPNVEEILATLSSSTGNGGKDGDLNSDGKADAEQSALANLAWISTTNFQKALSGTLTEVKPIVSLAVAAVNTASGKAAQVGDTQYQLSKIQVVPQDAGVVGGKSVDKTITDQGTRIDAPWDPLQFTISPQDAGTGLVDIDPTRSGTQILTTIDVARAELKEGDFNGYLKYVSQGALDAAKAQGIVLTTLDGAPIVQADWYDFTQRQDDSGNYVGDGARYLIENGKIVGIALTLTDNAFGDDDMTADKIFDPGMPVLLTPNAPPVIDLKADDATTLSRAETFRGNGDVLLFGESASINLSDMDNDNLTRLSVSIDKNTLEKGDQLLIGSTVIDLTRAGASGTIKAGTALFGYAMADSGETRTLTFTSRDADNTVDTSASQADFDRLLDTLGFKNASGKFADGNRTFSVAASDAYTNSAPAVLTINVDAIKWVRSSSDVTLASDVDNVELLGATWNLECLPDWLRQSVKINSSASAKFGHINAIGNALNNQMVGNAGNNTLAGKSGNDGIYGLDGSDTLNGNTGADTLSGGNGKDLLTGGPGLDRLTGNAGKDEFNYLGLEDSGVGVDNRDIITDFITGDKLNLSNLDADATKSGDQAFRYIGNGPFGNIPGQLRFEGNVLQADTNGDGVADFEVELMGLTNLSVNDIAL